MSAKFPSTPVSLIDRLRTNHGSRDWNSAWTTFVELYGLPLIFCAQVELHRVGWHRQDDQLIEELVSDAVVKFLKASGSFSYDPAKGKFRNYLRQIMAWCVRDHLTANNRPIATSEELDTIADEKSSLPIHRLIRIEERSWRLAALQSMLEEARQVIGPQTLLIFEMTKIMHQPVEDVMEQLRVSRSTVDNANHRVMRLLRELAASPAYSDEIS